MGNGGELANSDFLEMFEAMKIAVKVTASEAPFSNKVVERNDLTIADMLDKVLEESHLDEDLALAWCFNAKITLANVHGFSPFQLALWQNPNFSSTFSDKPPAYVEQGDGKIFIGDLTSLYKTREEFVASEASEKINRALSNKVRSGGDTIYFTRDSVYFKMVKVKR